MYTDYTDVFTKLMMNQDETIIQRKMHAQAKAEAEAASRKNRYK